MALNDGALSAPSGVSKVVRKFVVHVVVQADPSPSPREPDDRKERRRRRVDLEKGLNWIFIGGHGPGTRDVGCGPSLYTNQRVPGGYLWIDKSIVKEELVARSSVPSPVVPVPVARPVVVCWLGSDGLGNLSAFGALIIPVGSVSASGILK